MEPDKVLVEGEADDVEEDFGGEGEALLRLGRGARAVIEHVALDHGEGAATTGTNARISLWLLALV